MSEGARSESGSTGVAPAGLLRDAVLGGPGAAVAGGLRAGVLGWLAGGEAVRAALASEGHVDARRRVLTGEVTVAAGLGLTAFDGTVFDLAATEEVAAQFAVPSGGRHPQARLVTLACCGTRRLRAAALGSYATSEQELVEQLLPALTPGTLNLADRNFFSMARWIRAAETGAELAWRVKNGARSLPAKTTAVLPDGSSLLRLRESDSMLSRRRAEAGDRTLPRLPDTAARGHTFRVVQISRSLRRCLGTRMHRDAGILSNEIDAQPSDNGASVVSVQTVKGEAVVEQSRRLMEHLTSHLEVHLGPCLGYCLCGCQELIERWAYGAGRHSASLSGRPRPGERIWRSVCRSGKTKHCVPTVRRLLTRTPTATTAPHDHHGATHRRDDTLVPNAAERLTSSSRHVSA